MVPKPQGLRNQNRAAAAAGLAVRAPGDVSWCRRSDYRQCRHPSAPSRQSAKGRDT